MNDTKNLLRKEPINTQIQTAMKPWKNRRIIMKSSANQTNITLINQKSAKVHIVYLYHITGNNSSNILAFLFCIIKNGMAQYFTYIGRAWKININSINLCQYQ